MSSFERCEYCEEVALKFCNCSSPPRYCCNSHVSDHMNSKRGVTHPLEDALADLSTEDTNLLKEAVQKYKSEFLQQVNSIRNNLISSYLAKIRRIEQECSSLIKKAVNKEMEEIAEELATKGALPLYSSCSFIKTLVSLKQSCTFSQSEIVKVFLSASPPPSSLDSIFSTKTASVQAVPSSVSTSCQVSHSCVSISSQISYSPDLSIESLYSVLISPRTLSLSSSSSQTLPLSHLSSFSIKTCSVANILGKTKKDKETETENKDNRAVEKQEGTHLDPKPLWELSYSINAHTGNPYSGMFFKGEITCLAVSDCDQYIASASSDKTIKIWNVRNSSLLLCLRGHTDAVLSVSFLGNKIVSGSKDRTIKIWEEGRCINTQSLHSDAVSSVCVSSSKRLIASGSHDEKVIVFDIESDKLQHTLCSHSDYVTSVVFSRNDRKIISGSLDCTVKVWKTETGELLKTLHEHGGEIYCVRTSGKLIMSSSNQNDIKVEQRKTKGSLIRLEGHTEGATSLDIHNNTVVSISSDNSVGVWDLLSQKLIQILEGHGFQSISYIDSWVVGSVKILHDECCIVSGGADGKINVWRRRY